MSASGAVAGVGSLRGRLVDAIYALKRGNLEEPLEVLWAIHDSFWPRPPLPPIRVDGMRHENDSDIRYRMPNPEFHGWMGNNELDWLFDLGRRSQYVVEVGCWQGRSTHALLTGCIHGRVYAVDHFKGSVNERGPGGPHAFVIDHDLKEAFFKNVGHYQNLEVIDLESVEAAKRFEPQSVDAVFVDADHDAPLDDLQAWGPKVRAGGFLCGHDRDMRAVPKSLEVYFGFLPGMIVGSIWACQKTVTGWKDWSTIKKL